MIGACILNYEMKKWNGKVRNNINKGMRRKEGPKPLPILSVFAPKPLLKKNYKLAKPKLYEC